MRYPLLVSLAILSPILACVAGTVQVTAQAPAAAPRGPARVAIVNVMFAVTESREGARAAAELKAKLDASQAELDRFTQDLERDKAAIEKASRDKTLSGDELAKRVEEWGKKMVELQTRFLLANDEMQKEQKKAVEPLVARMKRTIAALAEKGHYDLVLDAQAVPFVEPSLDLTDQAIAAFNEGAQGSRLAP